jgi:hypothetical protein
MPLVSVTGAQLAFGHVALLDGVDFSIERGERVALIGRNGTGKSSLLRAIAGEIALDDGLLVRHGGSSVAYVAQEPQFGEARTISEAVATGLGEQAALAARYELVAQALSDPAQADQHDALLAEMGVLQSRLDAGDGWAVAHRIERVLSQHLDTFPLSFKTFVSSMPSWVNEKLRVPSIIKKELKYKGDVFFIQDRGFRTTTATPASNAVIAPCNRDGASIRSSAHRAPPGSALS